MCTDFINFAELKCARTCGLCAVIGQVKQKGSIFIIIRMKYYIRVDMEYGFVRVYLLPHPIFMYAKYVSV